MGIGSFCYTRVTDVYCDNRLPVRPNIKRGDEFKFKKLADVCERLASELHADIIESGFSESGEPDEFSISIRPNGGNDYVVVFFEIIFDPQTVGERDLYQALGF